jgi:hypothetical protein
MYGSNNMKKSVVFNNQFTPKLGGQFELESGGQFAPELVVNLHWKVVVNLTGFSSITYLLKLIMKLLVMTRGTLTSLILSC